MRGVHAVGYDVPERQYMVRPESVHDARGACRNDLFVHLRACIAALGRVRGVHPSVENRLLRHDGDMMGCHGCITLIDPVVAVGYHPVDGVCRAGDSHGFRDVVAGENVLERAIFDVGTDRPVVESGGDVPAAPHGVVGFGTIRPSLKYALSVHLLLERPEAVKRYNFFYIHMIS